ncbi:MAG: PAS domain-containing protein [Mycobacterium sp.]|nr:PAS domain-containing protein [Mycobacterium sp.]
MPTPVLATGLDGVLIYTNPAFAGMLGYPDTTALNKQGLTALLAGYAETEPRDCVAALRAAGTAVIDWLHAEGFPVRTLVSDALLVRATDPILLISITDITELMWTASTARGFRATG